MAENIFFENRKKLALEEYMNFNAEERSNLGKEIPVFVYRLMEFAIREQLSEQLGEEEQIRIFRSAGYRAGAYFAKHEVEPGLEIGAFISALQARLEELKIGILRVEKLNETTGEITLTMSEDADCSGLPLLGETVCNYDEGFISGVLSSYMNKEYHAVEVDCWATGDRVCRFLVKQAE